MNRLKSSFLMARRAFATQWILYPRVKDKGLKESHSIPRVREVKETSDEKLYKLMHGDQVILEARCGWNHTRTIMAGLKGPVTLFVNEQVRYTRV